MITTNNFKIEKTHDLTSNFIESKIKSLGIDPLRWAIVEVKTDCYIVSVSYEKTDKF